VGEKCAGCGVIVAQTPVGERAAVTVLRRSREKTFTVKVGELTDQRAEAEGGEERGERWGLTVAKRNPQCRSRRSFSSLGARFRLSVLFTNVSPPSLMPSPMMPSIVVVSVGRTTGQANDVECQNQCQRQSYLLHCDFTSFLGNSRKLKLLLVSRAYCVPVKTLSLRKHLFWFPPTSGEE
jgi:hypothetical protein